MPRSHKSYVDGAYKGWETRWTNAIETGAKLGPKGQEFASVVERELRRDVQDFEDYTEAPVYDDEWEIDY